MCLQFGRAGRLEKTRGVVTVVVQREVWEVGRCEVLACGVWDVAVRAWTLEKLGQVTHTRRSQCQCRWRVAISNGCRVELATLEIFWARWKRMRVLSVVHGRVYWSVCMCINFRWLKVWFTRRCRRHQRCADVLDISDLPGNRHTLLRSPVRTSFTGLPQPWAPPREKKHTNCPF